MNNIDLIGDDACVKQLVAGDFSNTNGVYIDDGAKKIGNSAFYGCSNLISVDFPAVTSIIDNAFYGCSNLTSVNFPVATSISSYAFYGCSNLTSVNFPVATSISSNAFQNCSNLTSADFPVATSIRSYAFRNCSKLTSLILRKSDSICTITNTNTFNSTPIQSGTGYIYVPRALVDTYKADTYWSNFATQFRALEDYTVDGTITGALDPSKI